MIATVGALVVAAAVTAGVIFTLGWHGCLWYTERAAAARQAAPVPVPPPGPSRAGRFQVIDGFGGAADPGFEAGPARDPFPTQTDLLRTDDDINEWLDVWRHKNRRMMNGWRRS